MWAWSGDPTPSSGGASGSPITSFLLDTQMGLVVSVCAALWLVIFLAAMVYTDADADALLTTIRTYVAYDARGSGHGVVCVDCTHSAFPTLTHHKDSSTPQNLKGDTSTDTVFNALHAEWAPLRRAKAVTCNHFDIDGLCSVWSLLHPAQALRHERVLREAALIGDMRMLHVDSTTKTVRPKSNADYALRLCCWLNSQERELFSRPFEGKEEDESARKFEHFLPLMGDVLESGSSYPIAGAQYKRGMRELVKGEEERLVVMRDVKSLHRFQRTNVDSGEVEYDAEDAADNAGVDDMGYSAVEKWPDLGVVVVTAKHPPHYYALFSLAKGSDAVVTMYPGMYP
jgi:hypothetical protein